jgi:Chaperone of endosialidase
MSVQAYGPAESDKRYEVVVKHYLKGVLHMAYFEESNEAHSWLMARWAETTKRSGAKDAVDRADFQSSYGGAIYDQYQGRRTVAGVTFTRTREGGNATSRDFNTAIGSLAGFNLTSGTGNVCIGQGIAGVAGESDTTRIRNIYSSVANARAVYVNSDNKIGTLSSSGRYKEQIKPMDKASETLFALNPVTFRYKKEIDPAQAFSFGLIAEEVAEVNPELITRDEEGRPQTVRYEAVNAMLLNEFLKEHRTVQQHGVTIAELKKEIACLTATVKEQAAQIQKVSAQLEASKSAPQTVLNNQ